MVHGAFAEGCRAARWAADEVGARRVVVVGAGAAGIGAASTLRDRGIDVVVCEARERIGGRVHTVALGDVRVDAGGAWLQQWPTNPLVPVVQRLGLRTVPTDFHTPLAAAASGVVGDVGGALAALQRAAALAPTGASVADVVAAHTATLAPHELSAVRQALAVDVDLENGVDHDELSAAALAEPGVGVGDRWLPEGYARLFERLLAGVDVRLGRPVRRIHRDGRGVTVDDLAAECCICTVPVWLLDRIEFWPELPPAHVAARSRLRVGVIEKVLLRFEERWWPASANGYLRWYDDPPSWGEWLDLTDAIGAPVVAGFAAGEAVARHHRGRTDEQVALAATDALARWAAAVRSTPS